MAKATPRTIEKVSVETVRDGVTLELTHAEARTLAEMVTLARGSPSSSARRYANNIVEALYGAGYAAAPVPDRRPTYKHIDGARLYAEGRHPFVYFQIGSDVIVEQPL